jgi:hypothetical protein
MLSATQESHLQSGQPSYLAAKKSYCMLADGYYELLRFRITEVLRSGRKTPVE